MSSLSAAQTGCKMADRCSPARRVPSRRRGIFSPRGSLDGQPVPSHKVGSRDDNRSTDLARNTDFLINAIAPAIWAAQYPTRRGYKWQFDNALSSRGMLFVNRFEI